MRALLVLVLGAALAVACGGKSKSKSETPLGDKGGMGGAGGGPYGGAGYGGYGGDIYGGYGGYGYGGAAAKPVGLYDCQMGIAECDAVFKKYVDCIRTSPQLGDQDQRNGVIDQMQHGCLAMKQSLQQDPSLQAEFTQMCQQMDAQGAQNAQQMGCTW